MSCIVCTSDFGIGNYNYVFGLIVEIWYSFSQYSHNVMNSIFTMKQKIKS